MNSKQIYWLFIGEKQYQVDDLKLKFIGKMIDYMFFMCMVVKGLEILLVIIIFDVKGNEQQVNFDKFIVVVLEGKIEFKVLFDWQQVISWCGELMFNGINIVKEILEWLLKFNGLIKICGSLYGGIWQMEVLELKLIGNVKQNKVNVDGMLKGNSYMQWMISGFYLELGLNSVEVKGELGVKDFNFDVIINVLGLDNVLLGFGGIVKGLVKVCGMVEVL